MHKKWHINFESYFGALKIPQIGQQGRRNQEDRPPLHISVGIEARYLPSISFELFFAHHQIFIPADGPLSIFFP